MQRNQGQKPTRKHTEDDRQRERRAAGQRREQLNRVREREAREF